MTDRKEPLPGARNVGEMRAVRPIVWPAYAVAVACLLFALGTLIVNTSLSEQLRTTQSRFEQMSAHDTLLMREIVRQQTAQADLIAPDSERFTVPNGAVVRHGARLYIAMEALPAPPKAKVYQVWTRRSGESKLSPSVTFVPTISGVAVVRIPVDGTKVSEVALSIEPEGGSKQPTSALTFDLPLN